MIVFSYWSRNVIRCLRGLPTPAVMCEGWHQMYLKILDLVIQFSVRQVGRYIDVLVMPIEPWTSKATIACPWMTKQRDDNIIYPWMTKQRDDSIIYTSFVLPYLEFLLLKKILNAIILREKSIFSSSSTVLNHLRNMYSSE